MYAKIFESIYDGSLRKDWKALIVFQQLLVLCDQEGYVDKTADAISARTTIPIDIIAHGIRELSSPDPDSRSQESEGRRIVLINPDRKWGWKIVNYASYRDIKSQEQLRAYWSGQKSEYRKKERIQERTASLKKQISSLYHRKPSDHWSYAEECQLAEIARRDDCLDELACIISISESSGKYFPQSVERLLSNWNAILDRARRNVGQPKFDGPPQVRLKVIDELITTHVANRQSPNFVGTPSKEQIDEIKFLRKEKLTLERAIAGLK